MQPADIFTLDDVENWLSTREVAKGRAYLAAVTDLDVGADTLSARVKGTRPTPYRVSIVLAANGRNFPKRLNCTCPVGGYCKHVAATLLAAIAARAQPDRINPSVLAWIENLRLAAAPAARKAVRQAKAVARLFWAIDYLPEEGEFRLGCFKARSDEAGRPTGAMSSWANFEQALSRPFQFVDEEDVAILRLVLAQGGRQRYQESLPLVGRHGPEIMARLVATGRCFVSGSPLEPLRAGAARPARLDWRRDGAGRLRSVALAEPAATWVLPLLPPWYVDAERGEAGELSFDSPPAVVAHVLMAPALSEKEAEVAAAALAEVAPEVAPPTAKPVRVIDVAPQPMLRLATLPVLAIYRYRDYAPAWSVDFDVAQPLFRYGETLCSPDNATEYAVLPSGETVRVKRRPTEEAKWLKGLAGYGFAAVPAGAVRFLSEPPRPCLGLAAEAAWADFTSDLLPRLVAAGWEVELPAGGFRHHVLEPESWEAEVSEGEGGWFELDMGVVVDGERLPLAPLLSALFRADSRWLEARRLAKIANKERFDLALPDGRRIRLPAERLKPLALTLIDLFDGPLVTEGRLRLPRLDAPRLAELADSERWQCKGFEPARQLARQLAGAGAVKAVTPPRGLAITLRPYQLEGLAWLQYLRKHGLAGILADDMGLGKTAQTLAHLLKEKEARRLDRPALVVLPTSLVFNWKREAARFAPGLSVLSLHGKARKECFADIPNHDVVLTTYPLLWRDADELASHEYHSLILDEAQTVKNAASRGAAVVRRIRARHRLCLTGTPLENHLGELWAQFDFLLPGFLGDGKRFTRAWRTPIEKQGDTGRRDLLARRLKPFILRRKKEDVAKELPPKTIILRTVELEAGQRDLYETVRSAMDDRVREEIAAKGFKRSQIVILDALLKLRQVCCDPRLIKSAAARKVKERAKLDLLMDMVPELVDEGRRILIFSQFTAMLALIEEALDKARLPYVLLTGDTKDRETPIRSFQKGEVPIFLISLKAGGVGLNLTAADTVIHYDPWWNPAVENQATDRAHRLGQTRQVFVYKLVVAGSIEEKILALQERKAELAAGILSEDGAGEIKFSEADLRALLAPLPD